MKLLLLYGLRKLGSGAVEVVVSVVEELEEADDEPALDELRLEVEVAGF